MAPFRVLNTSGMAFSIELQDQEVYEPTLLIPPYPQPPGVQLIEGVPVGLHIAALLHLYLI